LPVTKIEIRWLKPPLQPKGPGFEHFLEFSFSFMNKMDKNKLPINNFLKLIYPRTILSIKTMFSKEQWVKLPRGTIMFPREKGA
jgi:hypothetical protein